MAAHFKSHHLSMIEIRTFTGTDVTAYLDAVADLRIGVFREWPCLRVCDRSREETYLAAYAQSPDSVFVLAFDAARVVGASMGIPLTDGAYALQQPFRNRDITIADVFFFGDSMLLKEYRGSALGHRFFDERERHARGLSRFRMSAFCSVERDLDDSRRPPGVRSNDAFWTRRGYRRQDDMFSELEWSEVGHDRPIRHRLHFWLRAIVSE